MQRLGVFKALAVFGSDAISSSAYATEAALVILIVSGNSALNISFMLAYLADSRALFLFHVFLTSIGYLSKVF